MLANKTIITGLHIGASFLEAVAPHYKLESASLSQLSTEYLASIYPHLREYYLITQLDQAFQTAYDTELYNSHQLMIEVCNRMNLYDIETIGMHLVEATKRLGSAVGNVSDFELLLRCN
jgi:hypothetical protein